MSVSVFPTTTTSFLVCTPAPVTSSVTSTFTETYTVTYPAACPTSEWMATYTVTEICTGLPGLWTTPACPPNFYTTTVVCDICEHPTQVITCPNALATAQPGAPGVIGVGGNGITVTVEIDINYHPPTGVPAAPGGVPGEVCSTCGPAVPVQTGAPRSPAAPGEVCSTCGPNGGPGAPPAATGVPAAPGTPGAPGAPQVTGFASVPAVVPPPTGTGAAVPPPAVITAGASSFTLKGGLLAVAGLVGGAALML